MIKTLFLFIWQAHATENSIIRSWLPGHKFSHQVNNRFHHENQIVTIIFLFHHNYETAFDHYLFIRGNGQFWSLLQEMHFYVALPMAFASFTYACIERPFLRRPEAVLQG